jgi:hypothetical protein
MDKEGLVEATMVGRIASFYYLQHETMSLMSNHLHEDTNFKSVLQVLSSAPEYDELPVRLITSPSAQSCLYLMYIQLISQEIHVSPGT